jgi:hypothetical protein
MILGSVPDKSEYPVAATKLANSSISAFEISSEPLYGYADPIKLDTRELKKY